MIDKTMTLTRPKIDIAFVRGTVVHGPLSYSVVEEAYMSASYGDSEPRSLVMANQTFDRFVAWMLQFPGIDQMDPYFHAARIELADLPLPERVLWFQNLDYPDSYVLLTD